jgi:lipopolysaccharide transport system ATP-binding protein
MSDVVIRARDLRKIYRLYSAPGYRFLDMLGLLGRWPGAYREYAALDGVTLEIARGEKVAIIGRNGAGKSTLLKLITRVTEPTSGDLHVQGTAHALLQIGTGFHPDFTGRDNVRAYLAQLGVTGAEADRRYAEIVEFAELEDYIEQPVKTYSTGMGVRLMFSAATAITPELLVLDEVLGVGDAYFAQKSYDRMRELTDRNGTTLLLVTHDIYSAVKICERVIWIDRGRVLMDGEGAAVIKGYEDSIRQQEETRLRLRKQHQLHGAARSGTAAGRHAIVEIQSAGNRPLPAPVYIGRIELVAGGRRISLPLDEEAFDAGRPAHLQREASAWADAGMHQARAARAFLNYGSPFHKIAGVLPLEDGLPAGARLEVDYCTDEPFRAPVRLFVGEHSVDVGTIEGEAGGWHTWTGETGPAGRAVGSEVNASGIHGTGVITLTGIDTLNAAGEEAYIFTHGDPFELRLRYRVNQPDLHERPQVLVAFHRDGVQDVCRVITRELAFDGVTQRTGEVRLRIAHLWLGVGTYTVTVMVARPGYYDERPTRYFTLDEGVYACHTRALEIAVVGGGAVASGTVMVGQAAWELRS